MSMRGWARVKLRGEAQTIPRLCPNCLGVPSREWRYSYSNPFPLSFFDNASYSQAFYYCDACEKPLEAFFQYWRWLGWLIPSFIPLGFGVLIGVAFVFGKGGPLLEWGERIGFPVILPSTVALFLAFCVGAVRLLRRVFHSRASQQPGQRVWGPAVYYVAARPEWLKALVELNPEQVDEATYERIVAARKPPRVDSRPFPG